MEEWAQAELQVHICTLLGTNESNGMGSDNSCIVLAFLQHAGIVTIFWKLNPIQATCSNLGIYDGEKYLPEPDCVECVKDLIRFLRYRKIKH